MPRTKNLQPNMKRCRVCKLWKDASTIDKSGVCLQCKSNAQVVPNYPSIMGSKMPTFDKVLGR